MLARKRVVNNFKKKIFSRRKERCKKQTEMEKIIATTNSYLGHFYHADTFNLKKKICLFSKENFSLEYSKDFNKVGKKKVDEKETRRTNRRRKKNKKRKSIRAINMMLSFLNK